MANQFSFRPNSAGTVNIAATQSSGNVALASMSSDVTVTNAGPNTVFINFGQSSAVTAATTTGMPVLAGEVITLGRDSKDTHVAAICASGQTATVYFTNGEGY